ncbi:hypothetical protein [Neisseria bergeri]|uniref:hypothetical protein n=1 Tax=Neisseria bergeri TaxID=1906581 RepID=UPI0027DFF693|nr:hypothetical protein [Neisseria bergeri]
MALSRTRFFCFNLVNRVRSKLHTLHLFSVCGCSRLKGSLKTVFQTAFWLSGCLYQSRTLSTETNGDFNTMAII